MSLLREAPSPDIVSSTSFHRFPSSLRPLHVPFPLLFPHTSTWPLPHFLHVIFSERPFLTTHLTSIYVSTTFSLDPALSFFLEPITT